MIDVKPIEKLSIGDKTYLLNPGLEVDEHWGIYCPKIFCQRWQDKIEEQYGDNDSIMADLAICLSGPESENYWEAWENILSISLTVKGKTVLFYQDGDVFSYEKIVCGAEND